MTQPALARRLGLGDAVFLGLASMIGAGVFSVWAPAAQAAGAWLLAGLVVAAAVAFANATASAQLAAVYPTSGGTYVYGREVLGPWWGFAAGWSFVIGKTASCAAMAFTFAAYAVPDAWQRPAAAAAVAALCAVNLLGVTRTARLARILVVLVLAALVVFVAVLVAPPAYHTSGSALVVGVSTGGPWGILPAAGLLFFAFAGYARIATMGEEVRDPARTIPRAIPIALGIVLVVYLAVGAVLVGQFGALRTAASPAPLVDAIVQIAHRDWAATVVQIGAALAALGALLSLLTGIGRTTLAMARNADLPRWLAAVERRRQVPHRAEIALALVVIALVLTTDLRGAIGFSSFGVLLYYFVANLAALRQGGARRTLRWVPWFGMLGCAALVLTLPWQSIALGTAILAAGFLLRAVRSRAAAS
ncbi:APC family permease [Gryllotalpicola sp.]|uniref:APC family permease n=1 Tax=Gryllotalpicola sp. TaxID=1932787 RepID=UPI002602FC9C|nr:APC family permease [Gryllotalpicola sp.]